MVQAMIKVSEHTNRILNIVKAKYGLQDKSQVIERMAMEYEQEILEPEMKPEFIESVKESMQKGRFNKVNKVSDIFK